MNTDHLTSSFIALRGRLYRSALALLKDDEDASDALQDTFLNLWKSSEVQTDKEAASKLFFVLRNVCIDRLRRRRTVSIEAEHTVSMKVDPSSGEDIRHLESLLTAGLTDLQRKVYTMSVHRSMDYSDIADELEMTEGAVRAQMCRARKKISENYRILNK